MLKIKDNVDLKELEKFGFSELECDMETYYTKQFEVAGIYIYYWINFDTRIIEVETSEYIWKIDNTIYDLIQAGLVEKVEE